MGTFNCQGWAGFVLQQKLKLMKSSLKVWHSQHIQNMDGRMKEVKDRMSALDAKAEIADLQETEVTELHDLSVSLHSMTRMQNSIYWQKSRMNWLKEGDTNSKKIHNYMSRRRRQNVIHLVSADGGNVEGVNNIRETVFNHFSQHFQYVGAVRPGIDGLNFRKLSFIEAGMLTKPFCLEEVKLAVWDCDSYKSPGPDSVSFGFVKEFWSLLKDDLLRFMVEFHRNGKLTKGINSTFIALISKVNSLQRLNDFRPISLAGSLYKILAKVLANRLRSVIGSVVSEGQSAFVKGKQILDGILFANEAIDEASRMKKELLLFKVDFKKAYDSVDLNYLNAVMVNMNFPKLWRKWIIKCVGTAKASVLVNGSPTDEFPLKRDLRQGDPLSPFLFLLAVVGLNVLMTAVEGAHLFIGYGFGVHAEVRLTHLQFVGDTLIIGEMSWLNVRTMRSVLLLFEELSGLKVNFQKVCQLVLKFWSPGCQRRL